ncbi:MAG TPA: polysaccharide deacetylase family protein [Solirubrobacteraceae bacterium]|nr:polysaccharide deacetylase family protein [Solirubrobacteraceae bacterium]
MAGAQPTTARSRQARLACALERTGTGSLLRRLGAWRGLLVLTYHRIGDASSSPLDRSLFSASAGAFERHVAHLARETEVIEVDEVPSALRARRGRRVLITFDDGYRDAYDVAFPILRGAGLPAVFFLATGYLDRPRLSWWDELAWMGAGPADVVAYKRLGPRDAEEFLDRAAARSGRGRAPAGAADGVWMTWDMAREMRDAGMAFGGHTVDHPVLARLDADQQEQQIRGCAARLAAELGTAMRTFSYPVGSPDAFDAGTRRLVGEAGCDVAFTLAGGRVRPGAADPLALPRMTVGEWLSVDQVKAATALPQVFARW